MKRILLVLLVILLPGLAHADLANELNSGGLNDLSFKYLQDIFGVVDGVLHGSGTQIMGAMFREFNNATLLLLSIVGAYVFLVSTINTAHEGEVMGRKWSSIWIPLRVVASTALVVPKATGYSAIQIFVMGVVVSGVAAADKVMGAALEYIAKGGVLIQSSPPPSTDMVKVAGGVLKSLTCMDGAYNAVLGLANKDKAQPPIKFMPNSTPYQNGNTSYIDFPSADARYGGTQFQGLCGSVTWNDYSPTSQNGGTDSSAGDMRSIAIQQVILDLQPLAQTFADSLVPSPNSAGVAPTPVPSIVSANNISLILAAADYKGIMLPYFTQRYDAFQVASLGIIAETAKKGWIMLGSLYFNLAQLNNNVNGDDKNLPTSRFQQGSQYPPAGLNIQDAWSLIQGSRDTLFCQVNGSNGCTGSVLTNHGTDNLLGGNPVDDYISSSATADKIDAGGLYKAGNPQFGGTTGGGAGGQFIALILGPLYGPIYAIIYNLQALFAGEDENTDPIIAVSGIGSALVNLVTGLWFTVAGLIFGAALGISALSCVNPGGFGMLSFLIWFVPTFSALMIGMFVVGATMAFYVPLVPFILFTFAALGWFASVIESIIAAPLVALGLAHPEGHEILGKAEHAVMLLANVFLRPTLMVFGFFGGAVLSHIGLWLLNKGFGTVWGWAVVSNVGNLGIAGVLWSLIAALIIYMSLVLAIINQTFGLIHQLPDELLRWLGGGMKALGADAGGALSTVKGDFTSAHSTAGESMNKMTGSYLKEQGKEAGVKGSYKLGGGKSNTKDGGNTSV